MRNVRLWENARICYVYSSNIVSALIGQRISNGRHIWDQQYRHGLVRRFGGTGWYWGSVSLSLFGEARWRGRQAEVRTGCHHSYPRTVSNGVDGCWISAFFFGTDKDASEIAAVRQVWPSATIQLCMWHALRAVRAKLKDSSKTNTQVHYHPAEAARYILDLEICWGSEPIRRPNGGHRYGRCDCASRTSAWDEQGRLEPGKDERDVVIEIFRRHYNMHPFIPDQNGTLRSATDIYRDCTREMYEWCRKRDYFRLWAYLWVNWYRPGQWELWARAANSNEIPVLKTTMIVESHWRRLKHDYLHRFYRPRIDMVTWILITRAIPQAIQHMEALLDGDHRRAVASWRKIFKRQWKREAVKIVEASHIKVYRTNPALWTCGCPAFLLSRFLLCKHLVHCMKPIRDPVSFFDGIQRQRTQPFWKSKDLEIRPEFTETKYDDGLVVASESESSLWSDSDSEVSDDGLAIEYDTEEVEEEDIDLEGFVSKMQSGIDILREQAAIGNSKFVKKFMTTPGLRQVVPLMKEIERRRRQHTMPRTWDRNKFAATMYLA